jgi:phosphoglycerate dehydrogenase-like enzyme
VLFCTDTAWARYGEDLLGVAPGLDVVTLNGDELVSDDDLARMTIAFFSGDAWPARTAHFIRACLSAPNLQWLHTFSAGVDSPVFAEFVKRGARLTNSSGSSARPIAQTVVMMILGLSRDVPAWMKAQTEHRWAPHVGEEVDGANLAVIGMGPIGEETARLGAALGMNVIGCRRTVTGREPCETRTWDALEYLLGWADYVVFALPLTHDTRGLIGAAELARMKPTARFINVGRGSLVDEPALIDALANGRLAGAGLDVFATEPLDPDSPLWDMPNVIITPHNSGATALANHRGALIFVDNVGRFLTDQPLRNEVTIDHVGAGTIGR